MYFFLLTKLSAETNRPTFDKKTSMNIFLINNISVSIDSIMIRQF